ncbi:hypothetical protein AMECASPLE_010536 [Ameca splendens]|uniref:Uncharacterized protein n=1 Tax=Ameca splendens TaxID=208324 RepID=A0ABV0YNN4_9TELE
MEREVEPLSSTCRLLFFGFFLSIFFYFCMPSWISSSAMRMHPFMDLVAVCRICCEMVLSIIYHGRQEGPCGTVLHCLVPNICVHSLWKLMADKTESIYSGRGELPIGKAPLFNNTPQINKQQLMKEAITGSAKLAKPKMHFQF